ncbi:MAG TPA: hypothetical protein VI386_22025 [Candidatus Sulfotelmatobacter sp.]
MTTTSLEILDCSKLQHDVEQGLAMQRLLADVGLEHPHYIYLVKVPSGVDPTQTYHPSGGSYFFRIRPNDRDTLPSNEQGRLWDWYLLSCPHQVPCPFMEV